MKQLLTILYRNFISPITIAIFILSAVLLFLGEARDAWFVSIVILINTIFACVQEIRAFLMLRKLELMSAPKSKVRRGEDFFEVMFDELKVGDEILLKTGDEIPVDAKLLSSKGFEVNEAMLTGESNSVKKIKNNEVWASSIVIAGEATAEVTAVGEETRAGKMTEKLKIYKPVLTPLQKRISNAISSLTFLALALALLIFAVYSFTGQDYVTIFRTITTAAVVVVPEGLLLASSMLFAYGSIRLAQAKVLPQKLSAIEGMALLDVLATDKTGTLTSPNITFDKVEKINKEDNISQIYESLWLISEETGNENLTSVAILNGLRKHQPNKYKVKNQLAFSSSRKFACLNFELNENERTMIFGAPEYILKHANPAEKEKIMRKVDSLSEQGLRVLLLAEFTENGSPEDLLKNDVKVKPIALVRLKNELREQVKETIDFLQTQGVSVRVISGDNPKTVSFIAKEAGINNSSKSTTGEELSELTDDEFEEVVINTTIFARILPDQKEKIIEVFKKNNFYTGMVGDGVNDALAIKASDLGVAMFAGAPATRRVADLVLLDNSFTALPTGMNIGNRIMQSIEMIAILFFHKIILGVSLLLSTILLNIPYPFFPRHITFMNFILVTLPTAMVTLFPPLPKHRINPKFFWKDTLFSIAPIAILSGISVAIIYWIQIKGLPNGFDKNGSNSSGILTTVVIASTYFGALITLVSGMILGAGNTRNIYIGRIAYLLGTLLFAAIIFGINPLRDFFNFDSPYCQNWFVIGFIISLVTFVQLMIAQRMKDNISAREKLTS